MAKKRKISARKIIQMFVTVVVSVGCLIAMISASNIEDSKMISGIAVHIKNDKKYHFVEEKEILDLAVANRNIDITHTPMSALDMHSMERVIKANPWVANADVYIDNTRMLHMYVTQRIPVVRIFQQNTASYYMDTTLSIMPLSGSYIYYTTVVTNVPELKNDSASWALRRQIVSLVRTIQADSFWNAQISQVIVDSNGTFELMPVIGDQRILFGDISGMREKFDNLFAFYKNVLNRIGWDKYETLDVRYKNQVIASPSLPYKGPVDKAIASMNWINSIVETEAKSDVKDSVKAAGLKADRDAAAKVFAAKQAIKAAAEKKAALKKAAKKNANHKQPAGKQPKKKTVKTQPKKSVKAQPKKQTKAEHKKPIKDNKKKATKDNKTKHTTANKTTEENNKQKGKKPGTPKYEYPDKKSN